eukprot:TRINITY_DN11337_c0_g1_i6.p1 TRINITY_DN11337_c0_g1~~TRINITY_DN11337_c0_g1_i6.p1  ORF type:complete len:952 (+),score=222.36 TRINITY_DN11337_c0_g1_i6:638-3493(+)
MLDKALLAHNCKLHSLPHELAHQTRRIRTIVCDGCRALEFPPLETARMGAGAVYRYLEQATANSLEQVKAVGTSLFVLGGCSEQHTELLRLWMGTDEWQTPRLVPVQGEVPELLWLDPVGSPRSSEDSPVLSRTTSLNSSQGWHDASAHELQLTEDKLESLLAGTGCMCWEDWSVQLVTSPEQYPSFTNRALFLVLSDSAAEAQKWIDLIQWRAAGALVQVVTMAEGPRAHGHAEAMEQALQRSEKRTVHSIQHALGELCEASSTETTLRRELQERPQLQPVCCLPRGSPVEAGCELAARVRELGIVHSWLNHSRVPLVWLLVKQALRLHPKQLIPKSEAAAWVHRFYEHTEHRSLRVDQQLLSESLALMQRSGELLVLSNTLLLQPAAMKARLVQLVGTHSAVRNVEDALEEALGSAAHSAVNHRRCSQLRKSALYHWELSQFLWPELAEELQLAPEECCRVVQQALIAFEIGTRWDEDTVLLPGLLVASPGHVLRGSRRFAMRFELRSTPPEERVYFTSILGLVRGQMAVLNAQCSTKLAATSIRADSALFGCNRTEITLQVCMECSTRGCVVQLGGACAADKYTLLQLILAKLAGVFEAHSRAGSSFGIIKSSAVLCPRCLSQPQPTEFQIDRAELHELPRTDPEASSVQCESGCWLPLTELLLVGAQEEACARAGTVRLALWDRQTQKVFNFATGFMVDAERRLIMAVSHFIYSPPSASNQYKPWGTMYQGKDPGNVAILVSSFVSPEAPTQWSYLAEVSAVCKPTSSGFNVDENEVVDACVLRLTHGFLEPWAAPKSTRGEAHRIPAHKIDASQRLEEHQPASIPALPLGNSESVCIRDEITLFGYPGSGMSNSICVSNGQVMQFHDGHIVLSNYQDGGSSGGPAVTSSGSVIGILSKGLPSAAHIVRINSVLPLLEQAKRVVDEQLQVCHGEEHESISSQPWVEV